MKITHNKAIAALYKNEMQLPFMYTPLQRLNINKRKINAATNYIKH